MLLAAHRVWLHADVDDLPSKLGYTTGFKPKIAEAIADHIEKLILEGGVKAGGKSPPQSASWPRNSTLRGRRCAKPWASSKPEAVSYRCQKLLEHQGTSRLWHLVIVFCQTKSGLILLPITLSVFDIDQSEDWI